MKSNQKSKLFSAASTIFLVWGFPRLFGQLSMNSAGRLAAQLLMTCQVSAGKEPQITELRVN